MPWRLFKRGEKPKVGFVSFTGCQGCQFSILFIDNILKILKKFDIKYFHLLKEKNKESDFDLIFVEGAISTKSQVKKLKEIRKKSKYLVAFGTCATCGGIPAMRNFLEADELKKHVYNQKLSKDSIDAGPVEKHVKVDYHMYGCPVIKKEFVNFIKTFLKKKEVKECETPVCLECPRKGKNCYLLEKVPCLGAVTHGGCNALCIRNNHQCIACRGPLKTANFAAEVKLFENLGLSEKDIKNKLHKFINNEKNNTKPHNKD
ncbi:NADH:ubiquinone oxidoreductase [archaeon]|jgi:sulfhydrogenase subunit delta|nr:NADH:ubiquinone oxidoreductase [archaeon]MBT4416581.1 NADH:ubiquinone oxidoreductase [archaeon]